jgi:hypothetical protein
LASDAKVGVFSATDFDPEGGECFDADAVVAEAVAYCAIDCLCIVSLSSIEEPGMSVRYFVEFIVASERPDDIEDYVLRSYHCRSKVYVRSIEEYRQEVLQVILLVGIVPLLYILVERHDMTPHKIAYTE